MGYVSLKESESEVAQSCPTFCDPMDCSLPGSSVHGFPRQKYWSGLPFPFPGDLPDPGVEPRSPALFPAWASLVTQLVKNLPATWETWVLSLGWEDSPGEEKGYPLQYSGLENSMDCIVHGVAKSRT